MRTNKELLTAAYNLGVQEGQAKAALHKLLEGITENNTATNTAPKVKRAYKKRRAKWNTTSRKQQSERMRAKWKLLKKLQKTTA